MTSVKVTQDIELAEGQIWQMKDEYEVEPGYGGSRVLILALGTSYIGVQDLNCESHFISKLDSLDWFKKNVERLCNPNKLHIIKPYEADSIFGG